MVLHGDEEDVKSWAEYIKRENRLVENYGEDAGRGVDRSKVACGFASRSTRAISRGRKKTTTEPIRVKHETE